MSHVSELLIRAGHVFTAADGENVLSDAWVRVQDERIVEITSSEPRAASASNATRIDAPDATLLPGLIDCHVHLAISGGPDWLSEAKEPYAIACWKAATYARATLKAGITMVRTLGAEGVERHPAIVRDAYNLDDLLFAGGPQRRGNLALDAKAVGAVAVQPISFQHSPCG